MPNYKVIQLLIFLCFLSSAAVAQSSAVNAISQEKMQQLYEEVKTPFKYGLAVVPVSEDKKLDCPSVFREGNKWLMTYIVFDGKGYETWLAESDNLLSWKTKGKLLSFSADSTRWDANQKAGYIALQDLTWGGSYAWKKYKGLYWMSYFGGNTKGYEAGDLSIGIANTKTQPSVPHEWNRLDQPVLTATDKDVRWWENRKLFKSSIIHDQKKLTGHEFVMYYNANGDSAKNNIKTRWYERIGMAVSDDMLSWKRYQTEPVVHHPAGITGDGVLQKIGDTYVMFYFGAFWNDRKGGFNRFAASKDLVNWTDWNGANLIGSSRPYDEEFAHKSFVLKHKGIVYHYYCAVNKAGQRGIAVATSKDLGTSKLNFAAANPQQAQRLELDFNRNWKFQTGDSKEASSAQFNDQGWRKITLPHDWSIEGNFSAEHPAGNDGGALPGGKGWYRKSFHLAKELKNQRIYIDFGGIYRNSEVWINGHYLGIRPNGYISFRYDLTDFVHFGNKQNVIAVKVDNSMQPNSRWYSGSGIYRNVKLISTGSVAVDHWGTFVTTPEVSAQQATIRQITVLRHPVSKPREVTVEVSMYNPSGKEVAKSQHKQVLKDSLTQIDQSFKLDQPKLWSPAKPNLYILITRVYEGKKLLDEYRTTTGIRYFSFDSKKGFSLNGESMKILGVCMHHDLGALGAAINHRAMQRQLQILKDMGCNAIRFSHNPPAAEVLNLCDQMGFLVMDEAFDMWKKKKNKYDYSLDFVKWHRKDLEDMVKRDRNHPSVILWGIGNEIREQFDTTGTRITKELVAIVKTLDQTRPVISALTETDSSKNFIAKARALDIMGFNYKFEDYDRLPVNFPGQKFIASETTSALETRGVYQPSDTIRFWPASGKQKYVVNGNADWTTSAYDNTAAYWGTTHERAWKEVKKRDFMSGLFVWTGFDYLGEPVPYPYPARSSYYGIVDLAGFPKDVYYMYQSEWTDKPVLHVFPHWNWKAGEMVDVWAYYSQADEVELFLNRRSLGIRKKGDDLHVSWQLKFEPGTLKAVSRRDGKEVLSSVIHTAAEASRIVLEADRSELRADGKDLAFITVKVTDQQGNLVPDADQLISFSVEGQGVIAGVDNGYQANLSSFRAPEIKAFKGKCMLVLKSAEKGGYIYVKAKAKGLGETVYRLSCR
ncbi:DUF4982 domain-containing protein [Pedobacter sp. MC2016-15]|nr:DUF4982 domain-containing protein [Pedobacter sp. MC2016-15]